MERVKEMLRSDENFSDKMMSSQVRLSDSEPFRISFLVAKFCNQEKMTIMI